MTKLVNVKETMTSREIAEVTGKRHADLMRDIRKMEAGWIKVNQRSFALVEYTDNKGEKRPMYSLSKLECLYIATKFNDVMRAKLVVRWEELEKRLREKQSPQWLEARTQGKLVRRNETDIIKQLTEYAKAQGSSNFNKLYITYTKLSNKMLSIKSRDEASYTQLMNLTIIENMTLNCIRECMDAGFHYKEIYKACKARLSQYLELTYFDKLKLDK